MVQPASACVDRGINGILDKKLVKKSECSLFFCIIELRSKILTLEKTQKNFGFFLAYSYLCNVLLFNDFEL